MVSLLAASIPSTSAVGSASAKPCSCAVSYTHLDVYKRQGPETLDLVRSLKGINFVGYDLVEVMPYADPSQITAFLAGNIMFEFISLIALRKKERR